MMLERCLLVRLGAMGDILHAIPAATSLKLSFPSLHLSWLVKKRWLPLLEGNPHLNEVIPFERAGWSSFYSMSKRLRQEHLDTAIDLQGLLQSAVLARLSGASKIWGSERQFLREPFASLLYTHRAHTPGPHRVTKNLQLVEALGATTISDQVWLPNGEPEGRLPSAPFVLANPLAGWAGKQWPLTHFRDLAQRLRTEGIPLVMNVPEHEAARFAKDRAWTVHVSSLGGLIDATRRATAVVGVDSGPLHLAAALGKPGVAIYGPTDPAQNGPYGGTMAVLRIPGAQTTYKRHTKTQDSMRSLSCDDVFQALMQQITAKSATASVLAKPVTQVF